tara:strand:- start:2411 stop:3385 length:975 start_codon:yes stop_codon:yes gene_type:complete
MKEEDIRPQHIFDEYLALTIKDTKTYFGNCERESIKCPACGNDGEFSFNKSGFDYEECKECLTLFVNPRPIASSFDKYYTEAPSAEYWATTFYKETAESRRELLWKPKAKLVKKTIDRWLTDKDYVVVDIGGGYGIFSEEIELLTNKKSVVIEPGPRLAQICRDKNLTVIEKFLESVTKTDLPNGRKVFVSFELFEHLHSPQLFLKSLYDVMEPNDLFIFTTLSGTGVDIRTPLNKVNIFPIASSATAGAGASGVYVTIIFLLFAALRLTLSRPTPTREIIFKLVALLITSLLISSVPAITASYSGIISCNSSEVSFLSYGFIE